MMEKNNILLIHAQWLKDNGYKYKDCLDQATNYNKKIDKRQTKLKRTSVHVTPRASLCTATYEPASTGEVWSLCSSLAVNEWCSDAIDKLTYFEENPNYSENNGEVWIHRKYKGKKVLAHYCTSEDGKSFVTYNGELPE